MKKKASARNAHGVVHITRGSDNIFEDLGFAPNEATELLEETDKLIASRMAMREELAARVAQWIAENDLKQAEAAEILHVSRPRVSDVVRKQVSKFSIDSLLDMVLRTGKEVEIRVA